MLTGLIIGLFIGVVLGALIMSVCICGGWADERLGYK